MKVHLFSVCWNEEKVLPYFFKHYKERFKNIKFTIYDNLSTDASRQIIKEHGAELIDYDTKGQVRGDIQMEIRNNAWKTSDADWVIVCDIDEWIDCNDNFLEESNCTIVKPMGYNMVGCSYNLDKIVRGTRHLYFDKCILFNRKAIQEINYGPGCHKCKPVGKVIYNEEPVLLYHMKLFHPLHFMRRNKIVSKRVSELNKQKGWSTHYYNDFTKSFSSYLRTLIKSKRIRKDSNTAGYTPHREKAHKPQPASQPD